MTPWPTIAAMIGIMFAVGFTSALMSPPGPWYKSLRKSKLNPPDWLFPVAWTVLYVLIGLAGAIAWHSSMAFWLMAAWFSQLVFNGAWSIVFFRWKRPQEGFVVVIGLVLSVVAFIVLAWPVERTAALLFMPYAAWGMFASYLNFSIIRLNPQYATRAAV